VLLGTAESREEIELQETALLETAGRQETVLLETAGRQETALLETAGRQETVLRQRTARNVRIPLGHLTPADHQDWPLLPPAGSGGYWSVECHRGAAAAVLTAAAERRTLDWTAAALEQIVRASDVTGKPRGSPAAAGDQPGAGDW